MLDTYTSHYYVRQTVVSERKSNSEVILRFWGRSITTSWGDGEGRKEKPWNMVNRTWILEFVKLGRKLAVWLPTSIVTPLSLSIPILSAWSTVNAPYRKVSLPSFFPSLFSFFPSFLNFLLSPLSHPLSFIPLSCSEPPSVPLLPKRCSESWLITEHHWK